MLIIDLAQVLQTIIQLKEEAKSGIMTINACNLRRAYVILVLFLRRRRKEKEKANRCTHNQSTRIAGETNEQWKSQKHGLTGGMAKKKTFFLTRLLPERSTLGRNLSSVEIDLSD